MSNTLTNLMPDLYASLDVVSRELVGFIPAVTLDPSLNRAAVNENVRSFVAPAAAAGNITPGVTPPDDGNQTIGNVVVSITKSRRVPFRWNGEEERGMNNGPGIANIRQMQLQQAIRTLVNEMEADVAALHIYASRATGAPTTTPFGTAGDFTNASLARKILVDNGAGGSDLQLVVDTAAGANIRGKQAQAQMQGSDSLLRQGVLLDVHGMAIRESAQIAQAVTVGTSTFSSNTTGYAIGSTAITVTGTGGLLAGDVITFAGDTNQYVVASALAAAGVLTIAAPGLMQALPTSAKLITVVAAAARNMAFRRSSIVLVERLPALPEGGDLAKDRTTVQDPLSGLVFEVAMYPQYRQMQYEISCAWGVKVVKTEHLALLLG